jgi:NAD(P)-dependent dehydrogenase (short-subunit alcohol dehydrogenase family)
MAGAAELGLSKEDAPKEPGNFGDPAMLGQHNEGVRNKDTNNGRTAIIAALGIAAADLTARQNGIQQLGLSAVRKRGSLIVRRATASTEGSAFPPSEQVGATTSINLFDPLGWVAGIATFSFQSSPQLTGNGRCVLITGCDSGFGQQLARLALEAGFHVIAACYTEEGATNFIGTEATTVVADLSSNDGLARVVEVTHAACDAAEVMGLYALVNNAALCLPGNIEWLPPVAYQKTMSLNFHAPVALTYELLPSLKAAQGRVVNVTSCDGFISLPTNAAYCASKHALESFSDVLRCEMLPWGVKVVVVEPGTMRTPFAAAFADNWHKSYREAPEARKAEYGDTWAENVAAATKEGIDSIAGDPAEAVHDLMQALLLPSPPSRMTTGKVASWFLKPLSYLPDSTRDFVLNVLTFRNEQPLGLQPKL